MANVAFIGLGTMGIAMTRNIISGGHQVVGYDLNPDAMTEHVANGGIAVASPAEAAQDAEIIITMLPIGDIVKSTLFGENGVAETASANALIIDMSTISPAETDDIRTGLVEKNLRFIDAPVGRTSAHAITGNLLIMAGGDAADIVEAQPVLACMGSTITDCGGPGTGTRMKVVNNLMSTVLNVLTAEVLTLAESSGLNRDLTMEVMGSTPAGRGHMVTTYPEKVLQDDISADFMLDLAKKDLDIALTMADQEGVPQTLAGEAAATYAAAQSAGRGTQDWTAIYAMLRERHIA